MKLEIDDQHVELALLIVLTAILLGLGVLTVTHEYNEKGSTEDFARARVEAARHGRHR